MEEFGVEPPETASYDPSKDEPFLWEKDVLAALEELRAEKREVDEEDD